MMTREALIDILKNNKVSVDFVKKDGSARTMSCTLREDLVVSYEKKTDKVKPASTDTDLISVWSVEDKGWRSFKMSTVKDIRLQEDVAE
jgi:hypothetical protein